MFSFIDIEDPIELSALTVEIGSWAFKNPFTCISQLSNDPIITILWDIDLSPGQLTSPCKDSVLYEVKFKTCLLWKI